jgi:uncharacterized protein YkwD
VLAAVLAALALAVSPCAGAHARSDTAQQAHAILCLVNNARVAHGLQRLRVSAPLGHAAARHARNMVRRDFFDHVSPGGSTPQKRARSAGYAGRSIGETIAFITGPGADPAGIVHDWLRSAPHRAVLLSRRLRDAGPGVARGAPGDARGRGLTVALDVGAP